MLYTGSTRRNSVHVFLCRARMKKAIVRWNTNWKIAGRAFSPLITMTTFRESVIIIYVTAAASLSGAKFPYIPLVLIISHSAITIVTVNFQISILILLQKSNFIEHKSFTLCSSVLQYQAASRLATVWPANYCPPSPQEWLICVSQLDFKPTGRFCSPHVSAARPIYSGYTILSERRYLIPARGGGRSLAFTPAKS